MSRLERLLQLKPEINRIEMKHNARKVYVFGSCARNEDTPDSDVDWLADFKPGASLFDHAGLECDLAEALGCKVVALSALKADVFAANVRKDMVAS